MRFIKFIKKNPSLKLASLLLAIALWFFVVAKGRSTITIDIPIEYKNIPQSMEMVEGPKKVSITIEGQERLVRNLRQNDITVFVELSDAKKGETSFYLSKDNVKLPRYLTITKISPRTIKLWLDETIKKVVAVRPVIIGSPEQGLRVRTVEVMPKEVEIEGPKAVLVRLHVLKTEPIDITGITEDLKYDARLEVSNRNIRVNTLEVKVNILLARSK
ncbi:MAG: hypothetical protein HZC12_08275 [Nitrospirae bacterium]|nr:hypothetical protein [Nitrospirota bacterium]